MKENDPPKKEIKAPDWFYAKTLKAEGGLADNPKDTTAVKDIEGIPGAKYHTNMGIRYGIYKEIAPKVLGKAASYEDFLAMDINDATKFIDHYWRTSGAQYIKDPRAAAVYAHSKWGGGTNDYYAKLSEEVEKITGTPLNRKGLTKETYEAINSMNEEQVSSFIDGFYNVRMDYLATTAAWEGNKNGWTKREEDLRDSLKTGKALEAKFVIPSKKQGSARYEELKSKPALKEEEKAEMNKFGEIFINPKSTPASADSKNVTGAKKNILSFELKAPEPYVEKKTQNMEMPKLNTDTIGDIGNKKYIPIQPKIENTKAQTERDTARSLIN